MMMSSLFFCAIQFVLMPRYLIVAVMGLHGMDFHGVTVHMIL